MKGLPARLRPLLLGLLLLVGPAAGADPLSEGPPGDPAAEALSRLQSGNLALREGFPTIARDLLASVIEAPGLPEEYQEEARLGLVTALINLRETDLARERLGATPTTASAARNLRRAIIAYLDGSAGEATRLLRRTDARALPSDDLPWFHLLGGLLADLRGDFEQANDAYARARAAADSPAVQRQFEVIIARQSLLQGEVTEEAALSMRQQLESAVGPRMRGRLAREYAVMLAALGRNDEALETLRQVLAETPAEEAGERTSLLLLHALLADPSTPESRTMVLEALQIAPDPANAELALGLLLESGNGDNRRPLERLLEERPRHPLADQILFVLARLRLEAGEIEEAVSALDRMEKDFPASALRRETALLRSEIALSRIPPQYRTASSHLLEAARRAATPADEFLHKRLAADLLFRNGDFGSAAQIYRDLAGRENPAPGNPIEGLLVLSLIEADQIAEASRTLDQYAGSIDPEQRWRVEWNLAHALVERKETAAALDRVRRLTDGDPPGNALLRLRLEWLEAFLLLETGDPEGALLAAEALSAELGEEAIDDPLLRSQSLLLRGEILLALDRREAAEALFAELRTEHPESKAAALSLLLEARSFAAMDLSADAQRKLVNLAETFRESEYAPIALFEAAIIAESRGTDESLDKALQLLDTLALRYPRHPLVFEARIREGDLLRERGQFEVAKAFYENTLNAFPDHPERYRAEISRAICILSNPAAPRPLLQDAAASLSNIADRPYIPPAARIEASVNELIALERMEEPSRVVETGWTVLDRFLLEPEGEEPLDASARYWLSRLVFRMGSALEGLGRTREAQRVYGLVEEYHLPGQSIARERIRAVPAASAAVAQPPTGKP